MINKYKKHILFFIIFAVILLLWTFPIIFQMNKAVYGPLYGTDNRAAIWHFSWFNYSFHNHIPVETNTLTNFPYGTNSMSPHIFPLCIFPAYLFSVVFGGIAAYNIMIFLSFIFSFACMYALVFYLTKKEAAAFISGLIYTFSPYHVNKIWEHFGLMFIDFIPLYILALLMLREKTNFKRIAFTAISLTLVVLSDFTYSFIISVCSLLYFFFFVSYDLKHRIGIKIALKNILVFCVSSFFAALLIFPAIKSALTATASSFAAGPSRPFSYLFSQSASLLNYIIPSNYHPFLGGAAKALQGSPFFGRGSIEQTLYVGWVALLLAYFFIKKQKSNFTKSFFVFLFWSAIIISMPPFWDLFIFKVYFPSFLIYKVFPVFRAYARFSVLALVSVSVLAGLGAAFIIDTRKKQKFVPILLSALILFDFLNMPPLRVTDLTKAPEVYAWLKNEKGDFAIAEYPIRTGDTSEGYMNLDYLLYQSIHGKAMLEGAKPGTEGFKLKQSVLKITDPKTAHILANIGFKYLVLHLNDYRQGNNEGAMDIKGDIPDLSKIPGFKFVKRFGNDEVYEVIK